MWEYEKCGNMKVFIERKNKNFTFPFHGKVKFLLKKLELNPEIVLVTKGNELLTEDDIVKNSDSIKILSVISGG